ncbi:MAG: hypothetical protein WC380_08245 [Pedobacter sp.]|jgi:hypothetical protein
MKKRHILPLLPALNLFIIFSLVFSACSGQPEKKENTAEQINLPEKFLPKPPSSYSDTVVISSPGVIFYDSDSLQLIKTKAINKEMVYESMVHDCFYQMRNAHAVLKQYWPRLKVIDTSKARYLLFIKDDKSKFYIDLNTKNDMCGMFMFDGKKDPELADMTNVDTALGFYFKK